MNNQDKIIKAAQAILNVLYEHDLTCGEALSVLDCVRAVIIVDGLDNGDIDESAAERLLDATALRVRQIVLHRAELEQWLRQWLRQNRCATPD